MAKSRKVEKAEPLGPSRTFVDALKDHTTESPLIVAGDIVSRYKRSGKSEKGEWTMIFLEVRGSEGRLITVIMNSELNCPTKGDFAVIPVFVTKTGDVREARRWGEEF